MISINNCRVFIFRKVRRSEDIFNVFWVGPNIAKKLSGNDFRLRMS